MRSQSGRLIELQLLVGAAFMFVVIFVAQMAGDQGLGRSLLVSIGSIVGVFAFFAGMVFLGMIPEMFSEWRTTPAAVRAARKKNPLEALRKIRPERLDTRATDRFGNSALHVVCDFYEEERKRDAPQIIDFLLQQGADPNAENDYQKTPLHLAIEHEYGIDTVRRLLAGGATPGDALLDAAGKSGQDAAEIVRALIVAGARVNEPDVLGSTALHHAASYGTPGTISELLARGADINARDSTGKTPLHSALWMPGLNERHTAEVVRVLVAAGADRDAMNRQGRTPRALAAESGVPGVIAAMDGVSADPLHRPQS